MHLHAGAETVSDLSPHCDLGSVLGFYGQGFDRTTCADYRSAYLSVILIEPIVDVTILAIAKMRRDMAGNMIFTPRLPNQKVDGLESGAGVTKNDVS